jgi:TolB protein
VEITGAGANRLPVAIADFAGERIVAQALTSVVRADLERSGLFRLVDAGAPAGRQRHTRLSRPEGARRRRRGRRQREPAAEGRYETRVRLTDVPKAGGAGHPAYLHTGAQLRATAHRIADFIYEKLTGEPGVFSTRIAYVVKSTGRYELKIADADGSNDQAALASREPIISPAWSPDGASWPMFPSRRRSRWSMCTTSPAAAPRRRQLQGLELGAGLVARRQASWPWC